MKLYVLMVQPTNEYPGQNAPNALICADEYLLENNPEWWERAVKSELESMKDGITSHAIVCIDVPDAAVDRAVNPQDFPIPAATEDA